MTTRPALAFAALALVLAATSQPRPVGDAHEYVGMSLALLAYGSPSPSAAQLGDLERRLAAHGFPLVRDALHEGRDGRFHHRHFWLYPAMAAPLVAVALQLGAHPVWGFTLLNVLLLSLATAQVARRAGPLPTALLFAGPIVWWIDKAHPEAFVFALVAAGLALLDEHPAAALLAWAPAAAQYPPLLLLPAAGFIAALAARPERRRDGRLLAAGGAALAIALLHPLHSLWKLGVATPLLLWGRGAAIPSLRATAAVYTDLNIGLLVNFPFVLIAAVLLARAVPRARRRALLGRPAFLVAVLAALVLPPVFAETVNVNHGATPGISRYALWLIPLFVPLAAAGDDPPVRRPPALAPLVALSVLCCLFWYHPRRPESYQQPTRVAAWVWRHAPRLSAPLPEIFAERTAHAEPGLLPVATPACSKVLLLEGRWPAPCAPADTTPERCRRPGALCYADRRAGAPGAYRFRPLAEPLPDSYRDNPATWPPEVEARVTLLLDELRWWEMGGAAAGQDEILRAATGVGWTTWLAGEGRFFLYASAPRAGGSVTLRLPQPMRGRVVAARNGALLAEVSAPAQPGALWNLPLPAAGEPGVVLVLRAVGAGAGGAGAAAPDPAGGLTVAAGDGDER